MEVATPEPAVENIGSYLKTLLLSFFPKALLVDHCW